MKKSGITERIFTDAPLHPNGIEARYPRISLGNGMEKSKHWANPVKAIRFEETGNARTYLILDEATGDLLAYFSVSFKELILEGTGLSKTKIRSLDGISKNAEHIRSFLIGQLGKIWLLTATLLSLLIF